MKSDAELKTDIIEKLVFEPSIDASRITPIVHNGIVTLNGFVGSYFDKKVVEKAVQNVKGVKGIADELQVNLPALHRKSDTEIATAIINALHWDIMVPEDQIQVLVENGSVTLMGEVDWYFQREAAEKVVRRLQGIINLQNHITISPQNITNISNENIKAKIIQEYMRNAEIDARNIKIEIEDGIVKLKGNVPTWRSYQEANRAAWSMPGVKNVENHLIVLYP